MNLPHLTEQSLRVLLEPVEPPCLSIYVPVGEKGPERDQARIRLKNQLGHAERSLAQQGMKPRDIEPLLEPVRALLGTNTFARGGAAGLGLLRSPGAFESLELPQPPPEITILSNVFYIKPLLELVNANRSYRVLALCQDDVRLFEGDRYTLQRLHPDHLPGNLEETLQDDDDRDQTLQFHTGAPPSGGDRPAVFHGHVLGREDAKERVLRFCQLVDNAVNEYFGDREVPLILAAAEPLPGLYRQANSYNNLHAEVIHGDPRQLRETQLQTRAWELIARQVRRERTEALNQLEEGLGKGRGTTDLSRALDAAQEGRVAKLFVHANSSRTAPSGGSRDNCAPASTPTGDHEERVNRAAVETLRHGGRAFAVAPDQMPEGVAIGALYRY